MTDFRAIHYIWNIIKYQKKQLIIKKSFLKIKIFTKSDIIRLISHFLFWKETFSRLNRPRIRKNVFSLFRLQAR